MVAYTTREQTRCKFSLQTSKPGFVIRVTCFEPRFEVGWWGRTLSDDLIEVAQHFEFQCRRRQLRDLDRVFTSGRDRRSPSAFAFTELIIERRKPLLELTCSFNVIADGPLQLLLEERQRLFEPDTSTDDHRLNVARRLHISLEAQVCKNCAANYNCICGRCSRFVTTRGAFLCLHHLHPVLGSTAGLDDWSTIFKLKKAGRHKFSINLSVDEQRQQIFVRSVAESNNVRRSRLVFRSNTRYVDRVGEILKRGRWRQRRHCV